MYLNRKSQPLPKQRALIEVIVTDSSGTHKYVCEWIPVEICEDADTASEGYLGTARVCYGNHKGIGFHAWEQNEYEFTQYRLLLQNEITHTYLFANGMVATFNQQDEQVSSLQGSFTPELYQQICEAADENTQWHGDWEKRVRVFSPIIKIDQATRAS